MARPLSEIKPTYRRDAIRRLGFALWLGLLTTGFCHAATLVKVGGYPFPPFVETNTGQHSGLTLELIELFNQHQTEFKLEYVHTSPKRRYSDFDEKRFDVLFFESKVWGWGEYPVDASDVFLTGGEVYIANRKRGNQQSYFDKLDNKRLVGVLGYHYGFAGFNADTDFLMQHFDIRLVSTPESILKRITSDKSDVGVITLAYLNAQTLTDPELKARILVSDKMDQEYQHTILVRRNGKVSVDHFNAWLKALKQNGKLKALFSRYNLQDNME